MLTNIFVNRMKKMLYFFSVCFLHLLNRMVWPSAQPHNHGKNH
jgi:hypothetical protein